jgi:signal transduction histidine kinase
MRPAYAPGRRVALILAADAGTRSIRQDRLVRWISRTTIRRSADYLIPWGVAILTALPILDARQPNDLFDLLLAIALAGIQGAALRWRRTHPEAVLAITLAGSAATMLLAHETLLPLSALFALGSFAAARPPRLSLAALAAVLLVTCLNFFFDEIATGDAAFAMAVAGAAWALGEAARNRRAAIDEEARRAVGEEQARIARELHDVIAHSVSVMVVQAAAADDVFDSQPQQARAALRSIESSGREAMGELRRLLAAVKAGDPVSGPQPGLAGLDELAERIRAGGVEVEVRREGRPKALAPGVDVSAYRIVQEALTNTLRHARARTAEVVVRFADGTLELVIEDDGLGAKSDGTGEGGHGIVGMRERAALLGGTLEATPLPGRGFRVRARLPLESAA